ncbi:MAG TPA: hypothetical protein VHW66_22105 [Stellaceae bacterium]|jgi:hypothetical protein|nr:hypothetical protein [Stellaceae bacterium]
MASPAQLVRRLSETTGVSFATVTDLDRRLVKASLRSKGGRGLHAARVTPLDAARLLTAILGSGHANLAVGAVDRYALTLPDRARSSEKLFAAPDLADLASLSVRHSFVDGLEHLITSATAGALAQLIEKTEEQLAPPSIEIFAFTQATYGRIRLAGLPNSMVVNVEYAPAPTSKGPPKIKGRGIAAVNEIAGDLEQSRRVTERTILAVAELFAEEREHGRA